MKKNIILHGHFYQPPREDPWTGLLDHQIPNIPFVDWNRRITNESYAACAYSRVLDPGGAIVSIINNYRYLSFNFGPTLLSWLEENAVNVYQRILEADRESLDRLGYGNAVAQGYNHTILPLDAPEDARTQIRWGLADFAHRFKRRADGLWLPECAVNNFVVDVLIEEGLKFVVLSPWQVRAVENDEGEWVELGDRPAPSDRPYIIRRPGGEIAAFFYDPELASGISFGNLLRSREGFESALRAALGRAENPLVSIATDGEIYGHHEPFGDMCLSALIDRWENVSDIAFTNYAAYLAENPPRRAVLLSEGEDGLGSSWSCAHGVARWMEDCGCRTGGEEGWNQKWRAPLRKAFDNLRRKSEPLWQKEVAKLTGNDPRLVLDDYAAILSGAMSPSGFAGKWLVGTASDEDRERLLTLMEGAKFLQYMRTSCGWFFSELSGIEAVQNMRYAYRAAELIDPDASGGLINTLKKGLAAASSNLSAMGTGKSILTKLVVPHLPSEARGAALIFWRHLYNLTEGEQQRCGAWVDEGVTQQTIATGEERIKLVGEIRHREWATDRLCVTEYQTRVDRYLFCPEIDLLVDGRWETAAIAAMPIAMRREVERILLRRNEQPLMQFMGTRAPELIRGQEIMEALNLPLSASGLQSLELALHYGPLQLLEQMEKMPAEAWPPKLDSLEWLLHQRDMKEVDRDVDELKHRAGEITSRMVESWENHSLHDELDILIRFLDITHRYGFRPLKPFVQNAVYGLLEQRMNSPLSANLEDLARLVNINPERFLKPALSVKPSA